PNFEAANPMKTPVHIAPVWYMTPFYAILRAVPNKLGGVVAMGAAISILCVLPWLDRSPIKSFRYRGWIFKCALSLFVISFLGLGYLGMIPPSSGRMLAAQLLSVIYFSFFIFMPIYTSLENVQKLSETYPILKRVKF